MTPVIDAKVYFSFLRCRRECALRLTTPCLDPMEDHSAVQNAAVAAAAGDFVLKQTNPGATGDVCTGISAEFEDLYASAEYGARSEEDRIGLYLVRPAVRVKNAFRHEAAFIRFCFIAAGWDVTGVYLVLMNRGYIHGSGGDTAELFTVLDMTETARDADSTVQQNIRRIRNLLKEDSIPGCNNPVRCRYCRQDLINDTGTDLFTLHGASVVFDELWDSGVRRIAGIPENAELSCRQRIQIRAVRENTVWIDQDGLSGFLGSLEYPVYFLDFEAVNSALPLLPGSSPWDHIPFLYSVHRLDAPGVRPEHHSFMQVPDEIDREEMFQCLVQDLGESGSIVVYDASFEKKMIRYLGADTPDSNSASCIISRLRDLGPVFSRFLYYNPAQKGSASLKTIMPLLTPLSHDELKISNGRDASALYLIAWMNSSRYPWPVPPVVSTAVPTTPERIQNRDTLSTIQEYCRYDTLGMVYIVEELSRLEQQGP
jgi:hypothetical protein